MLTQDDDPPRLRSFSGPSTAAELTSKASKKKKRDPSPLSRMGSSLLRPFTKGLHRLRTSRSSDKDGKLQAQSRTASQSDSLASRATSASTQDSAMPSRFNSVSLQPQVQTLGNGGKSAPVRSESFRFKSLATEAAPELAAEPSFAQDLPHNNRLGQTKTSTSTTEAARSHRMVGEATGGAPGSSSHTQKQAGNVSDDEFDYDFSQPASWSAGGHHSTASELAADASPPRVTRIASAHPQIAVSKDSKAGSAVELQGNGRTQSDNKAGYVDITSASVDTGKFRPQLSRADRPQLAIATASVYSPLELGAATSPTMRATASGDTADDAFEHQPEAAIVEPAGAVTAAVKSGKQQAEGLLESDGALAVTQHQLTGKDDKGFVEVGASQAGKLAAATKPRENVDSHQQADSSAASRASQQQTQEQSPNTAVLGAEAADLSGSESSAPSSPASSEFDIVEALPDRSPQQLLSDNSTGSSQPASPTRSQVEQFNTQQSGFSHSPILGPVAVPIKPAGNANHSGDPILASSLSEVKQAGAADRPSSVYANFSQESGAILASWQSSGGHFAAGQSPAKALSSPRQGFSDKPILAVYSRRPSADGEAVETAQSGNLQVSDGALRAKVGMCFISFILLFIHSFVRLFVRSHSFSR